MNTSHQEIHTHKSNTKLLVSSPKDPNRDGGLFVIDFSLNNVSRILSGDCRGIAQSPNGFFLGTNSHGILQLDNELNVTNRFSVPPLDIHGLRIDNDHFLYVAETKHNRIGIYQTNPFCRVDEIIISPEESDHNHINDIWIEGDIIYVSMFSLKGNWKQISGEYDGVVAKYHLKDKYLLGILHKDLQLPHSVMKINNETYLCESLNMNLLKESNVYAQFNGFTRGLAFDGTHFYIGQSEMRHLDKILSRNTNVSLDCGIHVLDSSTKTNRFIHFPANQIYEIIVLNTENKQEKTIIDLTLPQSENYINLEEWYGAEPTHRWMKMKNATLNIELPYETNKIILNTFNGFPGEFFAELSLNGKFVSSLRYNKSENKTFTIPLSITTRKIELSINSPMLWKPSEVLGSSDERLLGIAIKEILFVKD